MSEYRQTCSLEVWTWTYYSAEANTQMGRRMHQNTHFQAQNERKNPRRGFPNGRGHPLSIPHPDIASILAPLALDLAR